MSEVPAKSALPVEKVAGQQPRPVKPHVRAAVLIQKGAAPGPRLVE
jgi:hypothetical protein